MDASRFGPMVNGSIALILGFLLAVEPALAQEGDPVKGKAVFKKCLACHRVETPTNLVGPHLQGVVGRKAATVAEYNYSPVMQARREGGLVWSEANLAAYLADPQAIVPGTKMVFPGLKKPDEIANLIAFLKTH
jgi:cytochrome c